jgi:hypothetical protein
MPYLTNRDHGGTPTAELPERRQGLRTLVGASGPYVVVAPVTTITFSLATLALHLGTAGVIGGAVAGFLWSCALRAAASWINRRESLTAHLANATTIVAIVGMTLLVGGGEMYGALLDAAIREPSTTNATLSALMRPGVGYCIAVNTPLEALLVPLVVFLNWATPKRRAFVVAAMLVYFAMRVWTYLMYAPTRMELASRPISATDVSWFSRTMSVDFRGAMNWIALLLLLAAALVHRSNAHKRESLAA